MSTASGKLRTSRRSSRPGSKHESVVSYHEVERSKAATRSDGRAELRCRAEAMQERERIEK